MNYAKTQRSVNSISTAGMVTKMMLLESLSTVRNLRSACPCFLSSQRPTSDGADWSSKENLSLKKNLLMTTTQPKMDPLRENLLSKITSGTDSIARVELPFITPKKNRLSALIQKRCGSIRIKEVTNLFYWDLLERVLETMPIGNAIQPITLKIAFSTSEEILTEMEHNSKNTTSKCPANAHWPPKI